MFNSASCVCAVNYTARCIQSQSACTDRHRFLVGTCSTTNKNELSVLEYYENSNSISVTSIYSHPQEIWALESSPLDSSLVITSSNNMKSKSRISMYKMPNQTAESLSGNLDQNDSSVFAGESLDLDLLHSFDGTPDRLCHSVKWNKDNEIALVDSEQVSFYHIAGGTSKNIGKISLNSGETGKTAGTLSTGVCWDPHYTGQCVLGASGNINMMSSKQLRCTLTIKAAHGGQPIRDVDFNPNKPNIICTAGNDCTVKFWDIRKANTPLKVLNSHRHWVWSAKYNPFHDQLISSGGSDNAVNLWRMSSISSMPSAGTNESYENSAMSPLSDTSMSVDSYADGDTTVSTSEPTHNTEALRDAYDHGGAADAKVKSFEHEETVFGIAWSVADAWMFCSLSGDGRVMLNHVPSTEKYRILL